ncbi:MAG: alkaline phosphatase D family protein [Vicingaceae bacterium]
MKNILVLPFLLLSHFVFGQLLSGPMIGHQTHMETKIWLQTKTPMSLNVYYTSEEDSALKKLPQSIITEIENWNTVTINFNRLDPNTSYSYIIKSDDTLLIEGTFKTPALLNTLELSDFSFAFGSCTYINEKAYDQSGEPFGRPLDIINTIEQQHPNFMIWLGDNIYLRKGEWGSKTGIYRRYTDLKSRPELQRFWKSIPHYAIWDDHDFGPNDADRSFINKKLALQAFKDFWANPSYGINEQPGITSSFTHQDAEFFLLDNRYFRSPNKRITGDRQILGAKQIEWLIDALVNSKASFKFIVVGGQFLSNAAVYENHATYPKEREFLLELIEKEELKNIVFLTGDRHKTELSQLTLKNGTTLYDFTSSPMASKAFDSKDEGNDNQVEGTHVATQNFGTISVSGQYNNRVLKLKTFDSKGTLLWQKEIAKQ